MQRFAKLDPDVVWLEEPDRRFLLRHPPSGLELRLGRLEFLVLSGLDGFTSLSELERGIGLVTGRAVRPGTVRRLAEQLARLDLVEIPAEAPLRWLPEDGVHCMGSGDCCQLQVGPLDPLDLDRLRALPWEQAGEVPPDDYLVPARTAMACAKLSGEEPEREEEAEEDQPFFVRRRSSGACVFLEDDARCQVHRLFGYYAKPSICRVFPLMVVDLGDELRVASSPRCPGAWVCGQARPLEQEVALHGDLLRRSPLRAGPLIFGELPGYAAAEQERDAAGLEEALLESFRASGSCAQLALAAAIEEIISLLGSRLPPGAAHERWVQKLIEHYQGHMVQAPHPSDRHRIEAMVRLLRSASRLDEDPTLRSFSVLPEVDAMYRRNMRLFLFTRHHLFRFGLVGGLALMARFQLLARAQAAFLALEQGAEVITAQQAFPALRDAFLGALGLGEVEAFPGVGARVLSSLSSKLTALANPPVRE